MDKQEAYELAHQQPLETKTTDDSRRDRNSSCPGDMEYLSLKSKTTMNAAVRSRHHSWRDWDNFNNSSIFFSTWWILKASGIDIDDNIKIVEITIRIQHYDVSSSATDARAVS